MIIKGKSRADAADLHRYMTTVAENERVEFMGVYGTTQPDDFLESLMEMESFTSLTKGEKGLHHGQINLGKNESLTDDHWKELIEACLDRYGYSDQPWGWGKHYKKGQAHVHFAVQRYKDGVLLPDSFIGLKNNELRKEMEVKYNLKRTRERDPVKPIVREVGRQAWFETSSHEEFTQAMREKGFAIAQNRTRAPFQIIDIQTGASYDLIQRINRGGNGAFIDKKEIYQRFKGHNLPQDKDVIKEVRKRQAMERDQQVKEQFSDGFEEQLNRPRKSRGMRM